MTNRTRTRRRPTLRLRSLGFDAVGFDLVEAGYTIRPVVVRVASGSSWCDAVRFPSVGTDATQSTGDDELDAEIRERAAEECLRLEAATHAAEDRRLVA